MMSGPSGKATAPLRRAPVNDSILDQPTRRRLYNALRQCPGQTRWGLAQTLGVHYRTIEHHIDRLLRSDAIVSHRQGACVHYFPASKFVGPAERQFALDLRKVQRSVLFQEFENVNQTPTEILERLLSAQTGVPNAKPGRQHDLYERNGTVLTAAVRLILAWLSQGDDAARP